MSQRTEKIKCLFCLAPDQVFWVDTLHLKCENCLAEYYLSKVKEKKFEHANVIQDLSKLHTDRLYGNIKVHPVQGDVSQKTAEEILQIELNGMSNGFHALNPDFEKLLWYNSRGALLDHVTIEETVRQFAYKFTYANSKEQLTQMTIHHNIAGSVNYKELTAMHEKIKAIPSENGNLIKYFIALGQRPIIVKAIHQAFKKYQNRKDFFGIKIVKEMCV